MSILTSSHHLVRRSLTGILALASALGSLVVLGSQLPAGAAVGDGPAPCSSGPPPDPYRGFCATYNGSNTWFGSYGPGFPTSAGWAFCAEPPASGSPYPSPAYSYQLSGPPVGADTSHLAELGYAFSTATVRGFWDGSPGAFTADQAAVAGKLLYDDVAWHTGAGTMDPGVQSAYTRLLGWLATASGATGPPGVAVSLVGGGTTFTTTATIRTTVAFPGSGIGVEGVGVLVGLTNATFDGTGGATSALGTTDAFGHLDQAITADGSGPVTVSVTSLVQVGQPGVQFFRPTALLTSAQTIVAGSSPVFQAGSATFSSSAPPPSTGTVSVLKSGDDTAYYPIAGAQFEIRSGSSVVATLVTRADGTAGPSSPLAPGTYTVHESVAPPGYLSAPDQSVVVVAGDDVVASFTGTAGDRAIPASLVLRKVAAGSLDALAGAVLSVRYDPNNDLTFPDDLGTCTTGIDGSCSPAGNDDAGLRPGRYLITEITPPDGYALDPSGPQTIMLSPGQAGEVTFHDPPLVPQSFRKVASGNVDPERVILAGATFEISTPSGSPVTSCTTGTGGSCTTDAVLVAGDPYCWQETAAPVGLAGGASGCFTATSAAPPIPIEVDDLGTWVEVRARKVDAAAPQTGIPGAVFDLYRMDGGIGPDHPVPPIDAAALAGGTWVDRARGEDHGLATFSLQLPGFAYCVIEHQAPANYERDPDAHCTAVLVGTTATPPTTITLRIADTPQPVVLHVAKTNAAQPGTGVPGATYDLYAKAPYPAGGPVPDPAAPIRPGLRWFAAGTTDAEGHLAFTLPAGHAWCLAERTSPSGFVLDPGLHCTAVLDVDSPDAVGRIAIAEAVDSVMVRGFKFNATAPNTGIPGASYALFVQGAMPPGFVGPVVPSWLSVPTGMALFAIGTSDARGSLDFPVPVGHSWCLLEVAAPAGFARDTGLHCTAVLDRSTTPSARRVALPELALTGVDLPVGPGLVLVTLGGALLALSQRRRRLTR
jgi:hypothetical protein